MAVDRHSLVLLTFDGIESLYCGVGALTQYQLACLPAIRSNFSKQGIELSIYVLYSSVPSGFAKSDVITERSRRLCAEVSATVVRLDQGGRAASPFGTPYSWPITCRQAAEYIRALAEKSDRVLVLAQDTPFAGLSPLIPVDDTGPIRFVWIAHSTGRIWSRDESSVDTHRDEWERVAVDEACKRSNVFLGAISNYIERHLTADWQARPDKIVPFTNGVSLDYLERFERRPCSFLIELLNQVNIPLDVPIFLSFARAQWYKGLDLAAELGAKLASRHGVHPVILALGDATGEETIARAKKLFEAEGRPYTLLTDYPTLLPRWLMQWPLCSAVGVMSRREPFGLIPSEYRILGPPEGLLITSNCGGLAEQTLSENEGIVLPIGGSGTLGSQSIQTVLERWPKASQLMCNLAGKRRVEESFNLETNLLSPLRKLLSL